jgi:hypothetical protein
VLGEPRKERLHSLRVEVAVWPAINGGNNAKAEVDAEVVSEPRGHGLLAFIVLRSSSNHRGYCASPLLRAPLIE